MHNSEFATSLRMNTTIALYKNIPIARYPVARISALRSSK
ncbi:hypothetical protein EVA_13430 [gut metagenome]|uniref:Uncharacterized protein n=1 Tax=gut metagenome TaxID=749906 RepID=J9FVC4_9ZZZZ